MYQAFFHALIGVRVSYVLCIRYDYSSINGVFIKNYMMFVFVFAKQFDRVVSAIKRLH